MLNQNFDLKIVDFGFAAAVQGIRGIGRLQTYCGTPQYMAPEIHQRKEYSGVSVDIFAAGKILFVMVAGYFPFDQAIPSDPKYNLIASNRADEFWY
jgi:serine/threonine protein kinase